MNINHHHYRVIDGNNKQSLADLLRATNQPADNETWLKKLIDSSHLITFCISISVIIYGSFRSLNIDSNSARAEKSNLNEDDLGDEDDDEQYQQQIQTIDSTQALIIPVAASISLLLMFFFFDSIQTAFLICTSILAIVTFAFLLQPVSLIIFKSFCKMSYKSKVSCCFLGKFTPPELLSIFFASCIVCLWIVTGHWILMDIIGIGFCVTFIAIVRLPSLKVSTLLLVGLVVYDVFWVYFSHLIFDSNVMVKVATREADNPMMYMARKLNMETQFSRDSPKLSLPGKLLVPSYQKTGNFSILGLGDIVVPGLLLCFVLRFDAYKRSQLFNQLVPDMTQSTDYLNQPHKVNCQCIDCDKQYKTKPKYSIKNLMRLNRITYFHCSLIGYFVGLITATLSSEIFREAQPALLYLVPFTLLPLLTMAYLKGDLKLMWNEPFTYTAAPSYFSV